MTAAEWDALPEECKTAWVQGGRYCACICGRPLPRWMAETHECPDCGKGKAIVWCWLPETP